MIFISIYAKFFMCDILFLFTTTRPKCYSTTQYVVSYHPTPSLYSAFQTKTEPPWQNHGDNVAELQGFIPEKNHIKERCQRFPQKNFSIN